MSETATSDTTPEAPDDRSYDSVDDLRDTVAAFFEEICDRLDDDVEEMFSAEITAGEDAAKITLEITDDAEELPASGGTWGVTAVERAHDVAVDAIQSAGRITEYEAHPMETDGERTVMLAPMRDNFNDY